MRKALVVGIDQYTGCPLHGCCNDADAIANVLSKNGNGSPNFDVRIEKNVSSKAELRGMIDECFAGDSDISLFYHLLFCQASCQLLLDQEPRLF